MTEIRSFRRILTPQQVMQPKIVSLADLKSKLLPYCLGYKWAEGAIVDLWLKGAPVPQPEGEPERRILIPEHFAKWWGEVQQRMGLAVSAENIYPLPSNKFRTHNAVKRTR